MSDSVIFFTFEGKKSYLWRRLVGKILPLAELEGKLLPLAKLEGKTFYRAEGRQENVLSSLGWFLEVNF